jgi:hypothetical protein
MNKRIAVTAAAVVLGLGIIYFCVRQSSGDVQAVLTRQDSVLGELKGGLETVEGGLPELQKTTREKRDGLIQKQELFAKIGNLLKPEEQNTLIQAYKYTEDDLTISLSHLTVSAEILATLQTIQDLLQANQADLRTILVEKSLNREATVALRDKVEERFKRADALWKVCDNFTEDLGNFLLMQKKQWLDMEAQVKNLKSLAQADPDMEDRFRAMTLLLELSGVSIENVSKLHSFMENVSKKQKDVERVQNGLLSVVR